MGTTRQIVAMSEWGKPLGGGANCWFHYGGNAHCRCPETELNDLDRAAVEKTQE